MKQFNTLGTIEQILDLGGELEIRKSPLEIPERYIIKLSYNNGHQSKTYKTDDIRDGLAKAIAKMESI